MSVHGRVKNQRGLTSLEVLISTILGSAVLLGFHSFSQSQLSSLQNQATQISVQSTARSMLEVVARDIRRAAMDPTCGKAFDGIAIAKPGEIRVQSDFDGSGFIDAAEESITYRYDHQDNAIERVSGGTAQTLMTDVSISGSSLRYFGADGTELLPGSAGLSSADRDQVRRVRVELAFAEPGHGREQPLRTRVATDVDLRNRYFLGSEACP